MSDQASSAPASQSSGATSSPAPANNAGTTQNTQAPAPSAQQAQAPQTETKQFDAYAEDTGAQQQQAQAQEEPAPVDPDSIVPEDGVYHFTMGEGETLDDATNNQYQTAFKEAGLTKKQADILFKRNQENLKNAINGLHQNWVNTVNGWADQVEHDKDLGGANVPQRDANMKRALKAFGSSELKQILRQGLGMHPEVVRFIAKVGASLGEDNQFTGGRTPEQDAQYKRDKLRYAKSPEMWGH